MDQGRRRGSDQSPGDGGVAAGLVIAHRAGTHIGRTPRNRPEFRAPARCRSETGGQFSRWGPAVARRPAVRGTRREGAIPNGWGRRRRGPAGRCADRRSAFPCLPGHLSQWGPRRDGSHPDGWGFGRRGAAGRCANRRSALQPSPRLFSVCGARHSGWQDGASWARVSRSRAMPVGDRRSSRPRACSPSAARGTHVGRGQRHRRGFRAPARCRSETGAPVVPALVLGLRCAALTLAGERHRRMPV